MQQTFVSRHVVEHDRVDRDGQRFLELARVSTSISSIDEMADAGPRPLIAPWLPAMAT